MTPPLPPQRLHAGWIVPATCVMALLHFGQDFLKPIAIAAVLSLVIAPLARKLVARGLGRTTSTLLSVSLVAAFVVWMSTVLVMQLVAVAADLPQYRATIGTKIESLRGLTVGPLERFETEFRRVVPRVSADDGASAAELSARETADAPVAVRIQQPPQSARDMVSKLVSALWGPVGQAGVVFILLVFILLEHESLGDRFIRLFGEAEMGTTVQALSEAAQGVSRFFVSQFVVNAAFGTVLGLGLWALGMPHAALWGAVGALSRFVPYVGVLGAAALIAVFGAAVDSGWTLVLSSLRLFAALELAVAHVVEPQVYGHSTGLAPLAVIVSALFWAALWGPVGLLLSTPLTLCLVVVGRHVGGLQPLTILLSESPGLNAGQRFYQRALAGNTAAIVREARTYLRRASFARYCDHVLFPGLSLGGADYRSGRIDAAQRTRMQTAILELAGSLSHEQPERRGKRRRAPVSLVDANVGAHLRQMREARLGRWQGSLDVPSNSIVLCLGMGSQRDDLLMELLVLAFRDDSLDARSASLKDPEDPSMAEKSVLVGTAFLAYPRKADVESWQALAANLRVALPHAVLATIRLQVDDDSAEEEATRAHVDLVLHSYAEAEAFVLQGAGTD